MVAPLQDTGCSSVLGSWKEGVIGGCRVGVQWRWQEEIFYSPPPKKKKKTTQKTCLLLCQIFRSDYRVWTNNRIPRIADHLAQPLFLRKQATGNSTISLRWQPQSQASLLHTPQLHFVWRALVCLVFKSWASSGGVLLGGRFFYLWGSVGFTVVAFWFSLLAYTLDEVLLWEKWQGRKCSEALYWSSSCWEAHSALRFLPLLLSTSVLHKQFASRLVPPTQ